MTYQITTQAEDQYDRWLDEADGFITDYLKVELANAINNVFKDASAVLSNRSPAMLDVFGLNEEDLHSFLNFNDIDELAEDVTYNAVVALLDDSRLLQGFIK